MNFCNKCEKQTPTKIVDGKEECMVCGNIISEYKLPKGKNIVNESILKDFKKLTKVDKDTGKYVNANKVGRNVTIGMLIILSGILYSIGGISLVLSSIAILFGGLIILSIILYIAAMVN